MTYKERNKYAKRCVEAINGKDQSTADRAVHRTACVFSSAPDMFGTLVFARKYLQDMQRSHGDKFLHKTLLMKIEFAVARASGEAIPL